MWPTGNNTKKEGFSYVSPELQRKDALKYLIVELVVIFLVVVAIFGLLDYFKILSFKSIVSNFLPSTAVKPIKPERINVDTTLQDPSITSGKISVVSDIPHYSLVLKDEKGFSNYLSKWGFWGHKFLDKNLVRTQPISQLVIHLTNIAQSNNKFTAPKQGEYLSSDVTFTNNTATIYAYLSDYALKSKDKNAFFQELIVATVYRLSQKDVTSDQSLVEHNLLSIYKDFASKNITLYDVKRN